MSDPIIDPDVSVIARADQGAAVLRNGGKEIGRFHKKLRKDGVSQDMADVLACKAFDWWFGMTAPPTGEDFVEIDQEPT